MCKPFYKTHSKFLCLSMQVSKFDTHWLLFAISIAPEVITNIIRFETLKKIVPVIYCCIINHLQILWPKTIIYPFLQLHQSNGQSFYSSWAERWLYVKGQRQDRVGRSVSVFVGCFFTGRERLLPYTLEERWVAPKDEILYIFF